MIKGKRGGFTDLFIFIIVGFIIVVVSGIFIFVVSTTNDKLHEEMDGMDLHDTIGNNASQVITNTMGATQSSFNALYWISIFLIVGMIIAIFIGSYLVTTKPIFFIPYIFITIIAIIVSVPISNAYETLVNNPTMASTYAGFTGANWIMLNLPVWVTIVGFAGAIIMFARMGRKEEQYYYGG